MKLPKINIKINRAKREAAINTIAITLTGTGAVELQKSNWILGGVMILSGMLVEYWKYSLRYLENKIK